MCIFDIENEKMQLVCRANLDTQRYPCDILFSRLGIICYREIDNFRPVDEYLSDEIVYLNYDNITDEYLCKIMADVLDIGVILFERYGSINQVESDIWELLIQSDDNVCEDNCFITHLNSNVYVSFVKNKELANKINVMNALS